MLKGTDDVVIECDKVEEAGTVAVDVSGVEVVKGAADFVADVAGVG